VFGTVVRQMLGDVQQRLIFMAQVGLGGSPGGRSPYIDAINSEPLLYCQ